MFKFNFDINERNESINSNKNQEKADTHNENQFIKSNQNIYESGIWDYDFIKSSKDENILNNNFDEEVCFKKLFLNLEETCAQETIEYVDSYKIKLNENDDLALINKTHDLGLIKVFIILNVIKD
jgi:hypothetical protein